MEKFRTIAWSIALVLIGGSVSSQPNGALTLQQVQLLARENYPLLKQKQYYTDISDNKVKQLSTEYLPSANLTGTATLQSEVASFPQAATTRYVIEPDQYAVGLELRQNLLYYGSVKAKKQLETEGGEMNSQQVEADLIKLKERINMYYGTIYMMQENKKILNLRIEELAKKKSKMQSAVDNGAALKSNYLVLESEYLLTQQKIEEMNYNLVGLCKTLSLLTNAAIDTSVVFMVDADPVVKTEIIRPEYKIFSLQNNSLKLREKLIDKENLPKLFVFGRGYYGRPGFNFLDNNFRTYGIVGAGLNWNLSSYYTSSRQKSNLQINNSIVESQKEIFDVNLRATIAQQQEDINKLKKMMEMDEQIVAAKSEVRRVSSSQLDNGVITSADYIVDLNADTQAKFNLKLHEIQLMIAKENYNTTLGY